ncbi:MAG: D-alanyl-D-alanine carboxypeptidase, partial [Chitinophagaceae bacterium]
MNRNILSLLTVVVFISSCSITHSLQKNASANLTGQPCLQHAYVGICIYDPVHNKYIYEHDADKYFTPASNTKLYTFYTGLNYIGDSTTGIQYQVQNDTLFIRGTGDPSLLQSEFGEQSAFDFLRNTNLPIVFTNPVYENEIFGPGWAWDDYNADYQPERSAMPLYSNLARFSVKDHHIQVMPEWFAKNNRLLLDTSMHVHTFYVHREKDKNLFRYNIGIENSSETQEVPFIVHDGAITADLLQDTLHKPVYYEPGKQLTGSWNSVRNVPLDSLFKHMLYRSDNFYAEQTDQMASMKLFDTISTYKVIHFMLQNKLKDLPDPPKWVDGSGLSRFNLFTPRDMVTILGKLSAEYPQARIDSLLPTGGKGTLFYLYHDMSGYIFAKTGSLNNDVALSGYLTTKKGTHYIFSILINHCVCPLR